MLTVKSLDIAATVPGGPVGPVSANPVYPVGPIGLSPSIPVGPVLPCVVSSLQQPVGPVIPI